MAEIKDCIGKNVKISKGIIRGKDLIYLLQYFMGSIKSKVVLASCEYGLLLSVFQ